MAITDLTGTKWRFNNSVARGNKTVAFTVECIIKSGEYTISIPYQVGTYIYNQIYIGDANTKTVNVFKAGVYGGGSSASGYFISYSNAGDYYYSGGWKEFTNSGWRYSTYSYSPSVPLDDNTPIIDAPTIEFTGGTDVTNTTLIAWLEANATLVEEEPEASKTTITYNGNEIASLEAGQTAIFPEGKKATGDVSIVFASNGSITYKGVTTEVEKGKTANLFCNGKKFGSDVVISAKAEEDDSLAGTTWQFNTSITPPTSNLFVYASEQSATEWQAQVLSNYAYPNRPGSSVTGYISIAFTPSTIIGTRTDGGTTGIPYTLHSGQEEARTLIFSDKEPLVSDGFIDWLKANATKQ